VPPPPPVSATYVGVCMVVVLAYIFTAACMKLM
jgi:hypothetical protein